MHATLSPPDLWTENRDRHCLRFESEGRERGSEVLLYERASDARRVEGVVTGAGPHGPLGLTHRTVLDPAWCVRLFEVRLLGLSEPERLQSDAAGRWTDGHGVPLDELSGCVDLEFAETAFTWTPMIRRLGLGAGDSVELDVVTLSAADLAPVRARRRLTCLQPLQLYRYDDVATGIGDEIVVDGDGFAMSVSGRFRRLA